MINVTSKSMNLIMIRLKFNSRNTVDPLYSGLPAVRGGGGVDSFNFNRWIVSTLLYARPN